MKRYNPKDIEPKWQQIWDETGVYTADLTSDKPKYIAMSMFNYPSGAGIHIGHAMNYTISDVKARFKRQQGFESYHPVGWDAFGLPAENYAIKAGVSPQESMAKIIPDYHKQYKAMGWSNDWEKEIATCVPEYYKWTQWIFAQMYKNNLAYQDSRMQWWCEKCQTVLANEQVIDGKCWRHDAPDDPIVQKKEVRQWFFKITDYADELLEAIDDLDWTESVKLAQKNWIGRSTGAEIEFAIEKNLTGQDFVFLHGYTGTSQKDFWPWLKAEIERRGGKVFAPDLPHTTEPSVDEQVEYVLANHEFTNDTHVIGHSLGGAVAMKLLPQVSAVVASLTLIAPCLAPEYKDNKPRPGLDKASNWQFDFKAVKNKAKNITVLRDLHDHIIPDNKPNEVAQKLEAQYKELIAAQSHFNGAQEAGVLDALVPKITVFTTRADTLFGATFLVLAPEHELVGQITSEAQRAEVEKYVKQAEQKSEIERQENKDKTGVFTGAYAINPANNEKIPIWIADYVLTGYGTGAIMAVPAHDERDYEFAQKFDLPIQSVVAQTFGDYLPDAPLRPTVLAITHDIKNDKYCVLDWKANPTIHRKSGLEIPGGGIENGESIEQAAIREFAEETGYVDVTVEKIIPISLSLYFSYKFEGEIKHKHAIKSVVTLTINSQKREELQTKDAYEADAAAVWLTKDELLSAEFWPLDKAALKAVFDYEAYTGEGVVINSGEYDGLSSAEVREKIVADLAGKGVAQEKINYKMRDWSVSRQRYWGAPIPIINCPKCGIVLVADEDLPVVLPELKDFQPNGDGRSALARAKDWLKVDCPKCGGAAERETDTLDTYIDSSWYMYRYFDPHNQEKIFDSELVKKWEPIDFYNGGDHATAHLLYARFMTRFFKKLGLVNEPEPFKQFLFNGKISASDGTAFSKSKGNGIDPLEIIGQGYGADALRTYLMFVAPLELGGRWDPQGVPGAYRFLNRLWNLVQEYGEKQESRSKNQENDILRAAHGMIKKVTEDIEHNHYNTAIAAMMGCVNDLYKLKTVGFADREAWQQALESLVACVAPFAPHIAEELWQELGHSSSVHVDSWPAWDEKYLTSDQMTIVVQINGKLRAQLELLAGASETQVLEAAKTHAKIAEYLNGQTIKKSIYVAGRLVNFVI